VTFKPSVALVAAGARASGAMRAAGRYASRGARAARGAVGRLHGAGWAVTDQCVVSAANFLTIYLLARGLDTVTFGAFMLAYTGLLLLTNMQSALVVQPHNVLAAGLGQPQYAKFTGALVILQAFYCLSVLTVLVLLGSLVAVLGAPAAGDILIALGIIAVPWMGQEFVRRVLYTRGRARSAAINDSITYGLQLFGALVLTQAAAAWATPVSALLVLGLSSAVGLLVGLWQLRDDVRIDREVWDGRMTAWSEAWNFGRWLTAQNAMAWFGAQGHSWVVGLMLGVEQVGLYRAATHLVNVMNPLMQACFSYLPSRGSLARLTGGAAGLKRWVNGTFRVLLVALAPFLVVLAGFSEEVLALAYGEKFANQEHLALILSLAVLGQCIGFSKYPFDLGLLALHSPRSLFYIYLIPVLLLLTVGTTLIYFLGIVGVPLSGMLINSALLIATWRAYRGRMEAETVSTTAGAPTAEAPR
jgi:O-antigen/teichoic acid export membrane protein